MSLINAVNEGTIDTHNKALKINLDPRFYGTFAEISVNLRQGHLQSAFFVRGSFILHVRILRFYFQYNERKFLYILFFFASSVNKIPLFRKYMFD